MRRFAQEEAIAADLMGVGSREHLVETRREISAALAELVTALHQLEARLAPPGTQSTDTRTRGHAPPAERAAA